MISQTESGLTLDQYNTLADATGGATWSITAHKYNLDFSEVGADQGRDNTLPDFDAASCQGYIFRTVGDLYLERFIAASAVWQQVTAYTGMSSASSIDTDGAQMIVDGDDLFIFVAETSGIWMQHTSDAGATFSSWTHVTADEHINKIAVVNKNRVHYTVEDIDKNIFNMRVAKYSGSWASTSSDIWYTYSFSNFVAAELPDGSDMIVAATQVPGVTTVKLVVNVVTKYIKQQGGIIAFKYSNDWWGDHYDIDVIDELTAYRFRDRIKLTQFSDRVALTCYSSDGTQLFPYTMYRIYTTVDGKHWSKGNALPLPDGFGSSGAKLCRLGDYVYAIEKSRAYKSLMTLYLGYSPTVCQLEIPHRRINSLSLGESDMMQGSVVLSNEDGWLDNNTIITKTARTVLVFRMGYWVDGMKLEVQTNMAEIDTYDMPKSLPRKMVKLTFRDFMAWMTEINAAERPYYWDSQLLGGDNFLDTTNDTYGGLRHLEPQSGSFTSANSVLNLTGNNEEGVGFSTFSLYLWNGITESQFTLSTVGNSEYGGLTIRGSDKDNLWALYYDQTSDKIKLVERSGGTDDLRAQTGTLGWSSTPLTARWLQVEFRYAHIIGRYSLDGITWTNCIDFLMSMVTPAVAPDLTLLADSNKERGYVGFIGKGYAPPEVETWPDDPPPYDPPDFTPYDPPYYPPYDPLFEPYVPGVFVPGTGSEPSGGTDLHTTGNPTKLIAVSENGDVWRSSNFDANGGVAAWEKAFSMGHRVRYYKKDPKKPQRRWFSTEIGLYVCENIWAATATATLRATNVAMFNDSTAMPGLIHMSEKKPNWMLVQNTYDIYAISQNLGNLFAAPKHYDGTAATGLNSDMWWTWGMCVPYGDTAGEIFGIAGEYDGNWHYRGWKSTDWGETFTPNAARFGWLYGGFVNGRIYSPYRRKNNTINAVNATHELYYEGALPVYGSDRLSLNRSVSAGDLMDDIISRGDPNINGAGTLYDFTGFDTAVPLIGDQMFYANPATHKMKFSTIKRHGSGNNAYIVYSTDDFITAQLVPGQTALPGELFTQDPLFITGFVNNKNFILTGQMGTQFDHPNAIRYTPNLGANWFGITPPTVVVDYLESSWMAVDCE